MEHHSQLDQRCLLYSYCRWPGTPYDLDFCPIAVTTTPRGVHTQIHYMYIFTYKNKLVLVVCHVPQDTAYRPYITFTVITAAKRDMTLHTQSELMENFFIPSTCSRRGSRSRRVSLAEIAKEEFRSHIWWCTYIIVERSFCVIQKKN